jgi:hypothetical protein
MAHRMSTLRTWLGVSAAAVTFLSVTAIPVRDGHSGCGADFTGLRCRARCAGCASQPMTL